MCEFLLVGCVGGHRAGAACAGRANAEPTGRI